ncbi:PhzF family phenazine biosynthesis protein [Ancylobacter polymorphus]|uniref:PhzF family phenazine biosynthesis protein n=1 Tax=Ancylobacter polymorphus TaxID=223390 RepID=A0A9E6ZVB1_9HYPH|nr:PhzF family phenazine biosynthesis protein [Ancylobacter polymorphus]UOK70697.1 PhzF family phenazine biosynthesis protein [Ancylobacter polymorphus]
MAMTTATARRETLVRLRFHTVDVFTQTRFGGNPLAVVLDADELTTAQMQAIAREFNYSESSFVLRPSDPAHTARVRIFTPTVEVPFAGHPNVGTAFVLASAGGGVLGETFIFEEAAGLVRGHIRRDGDRIAQICLSAPQPLRLGQALPADAIADCLSLSTADISCDRHPPRVASVGLAFVVVEIASRAALSRAKANLPAFAALLPCDGADAIYLYCRELGAADGAVDVTARMFSPFDNLPEDPATGSATAAACAWFAALEGGVPRRFEVAQGVDMGRPSRIAIEVTPDAVVIGGACVPVMSGEVSV